jgi:hypothetical protein
LHRSRRSASASAARARYYADGGSDVDEPPPDDADAAPGRPRRQAGEPVVHQLRLGFLIDAADRAYRFERAAKVVRAGGDAVVTCAPKSHTSRDSKYTNDVRLATARQYADELRSLAGEGTRLVDGPRMVPGKKREVAFRLRGPASAGAPLVAQAAAEAELPLPSSRQTRPAASPPMASVADPSLRCDLCGGPHAWLDCPR